MPVAIFPISSEDLEIKIRLMETTPDKFTIDSPYTVKVFFHNKSDHPITLSLIPAHFF
jgi:hypothetical protein